MDFEAVGFTGLIQKAEQAEKEDDDEISINSLMNLHVWAKQEHIELL